MIVTLKNDTLVGEIKNRIQHSGRTSMFILYRPIGQEKNTKFRADKIKFYEYNNRVYLPKVFSNQPPGFIELLEKGNLNLYYTKYLMIGGKQDPIAQSVYIGGQDKVLEFYLEHSDKNEKKLSGPIPLQAKKFRKFMSDYLQDFPDLAEKISSKKYTAEHIQEIIKLYNTYKY